MDHMGRLAQLKNKAMKKISDAASKHDVQRIRYYTAIASRIDEDERAMAGLLEQADNYERALNGDAPPPSLPVSLGSTETKTHQAQDNSRQSQDDIVPIVDAKVKTVDLRPSPKQSQGKKMGRDRRREFAAKHRLRHLRGSVYQTEPEPFGLSKKVVIACAHEQRPGRWFLGVKDDQYDIVALLCQLKDSGEKLDFVLPNTFLQKVWTSLSRSHGQVLFNVVANGGNFSFLVPGHDPESINQFLGTDKPL